MAHGGAFQKESEIFDIASEKYLKAICHPERVYWAGRMLEKLRELNLLTGRRMTQKLREEFNG